MFKIKKRLVVVALIIGICIGVSVSFLRQQYVPPILMYHMIDTKIDPPSQRLIVAPETFERQMHFLKERGYNVVSLEKMAVLICSKKRMPPKTVAITFDDGPRDNYTNAFPILKKYNLPATMFIIVNEVGRPQGDRLSWEEIKIMQNSGLVTFGSHALGPDPLTKIKQDTEIKRQIFESKRIIEEKLGRPVNIFSYPQGGFNAKIRQWVIDAGYKLAVATRPGRNYSKDDIFLLKRIRISENTRNLFVFQFEISGYYTFFKEKKRGR